MTREEQIKQASLNENNYILADNEVDCISFQDGARWADSHPDWHKYPEDPPQVEEDQHQYLIIIEMGAYTVGRYVDGKFCDLYGFEDVFDPLEDQDIIVAWKELPEPPKFD